MALSTADAASGATAASMLLVDSLLNGTERNSLRTLAQSNGVLQSLAARRVIRELFGWAASDAKETEPPASTFWNQARRFASADGHAGLNTNDILSVFTCMRRFPGDDHKSAASRRTPSRLAFVLYWKKVLAYSTTSQFQYDPDAVVFELNTGFVVSPLKVSAGYGMEHGVNDAAFVDVRAPDMDNKAYGALLTIDFGACAYTSAFDENGHLRPVNEKSASLEYDFRGGERVAMTAYELVACRIFKLGEPVRFIERIFSSCGVVCLGLSCGGPMLMLRLCCRCADAASRPRAVCHDGSQFVGGSC